MKPRFLLLLPLAVVGIAATSHADEAPVPDNAIEALEARMAKGEIKLTYASDGHGYLKSVLAALKVSQESQVLPFTKSSLQFDRISPATPRAIYFNDDLAVGSVHPGGLIEIIADDRRGGIAFYTLDNNAPGTPPHFQTESARCAVCHGMVNTVTPGWIVANITATADGTPQIMNPAKLAKYCTPEGKCVQYYRHCKADGTYCDFEFALSDNTIPARITIKDVNSHALDQIGIAIDPDKPNVGTPFSALTVESKDDQPPFQN